MSASKELESLTKAEERTSLLPHLYGQRMYPWQKTFIESTNKQIFICSANQIGKSSIQIKKMIQWATSPQYWKKLWPEWASTPRQFWYLYPSSGVATVEFEKKWIPEFLPRGKMKEDLIYGWNDEYKGGFIQACHFNTGVTVYFKTYSQNQQDLQTSTAHYIGFDEELPEDLYSEIQLRLVHSEGFLSGVFTPTLGQEFWREAIEVRGYKERFPDALKMQVSMYDCLMYSDGTKSFWTEERIQRIKNACKSEAEIQRRVYGRFVLDSGLRYPSFNRDSNIIRPITIPNDYNVFIGVDYGSGGDNHPSAVVFTAVSPDFQKGYIFKGRRFDNQITTASDVVTMVQQMRAEVTNPISAIFYDHACTDMREIASRMGESWVPAEKSHAIGEGYLNVLFKNQMLQCFDLEELAPLYVELSMLKQTTPKNQAKDDYIDAARYSNSKIPWDFSVINAAKPIVQKQKTEQELRRSMFFQEQETGYDILREMEALQELHDIW